jgi:hypothetical protein
MPHVIAWDLETIPDISGFAVANHLLGKLPEEVRAAMGSVGFDAALIPSRSQCKTVPCIISSVEFRVCFTATLMS